VTGRSILRLLPPILLLAGALAGCSDDSAVATVTTTAAPVTDAGGTELPGSGTIVDVDALDNRFEPLTVSVQAGTAVRFVNAGRNDHNVVPETGDAWGVQQADFGPGAEYSYAFDTPGTYQYVCTIHGTFANGKGIGMVGTVEVTAG
jgi:plastocyanin